MNALRRTLVLGLVLGVTGCTTLPSSAPAPSAPPPPAAPGAPPPLVVERQWLQSWFRGTPVVIAQQGAGPVSVGVPLDFSFDPGRAVVKPPLAAVLDKLAESLRRQPGLRLAVVSAPGDRAEDAKLALQRAGAMRAHLAGRGVGSAQLGAPTSAAGRAVRLQLETRDAPM